MDEQTPIFTIPIGDSPPQIMDAIIEIPRGPATKYAYREDLDALCRDETDRSTLPFPADYGFVPYARSEDGDLLDVFVLGINQASPGTVVSVRPIGILDMTDDGGHDQKIIGIAEDAEALASVTDVRDVDDETREEIKRFLIAYKRENGQSLTLDGWHGRTEAYEAINAARARYCPSPPH